MTQIPSQKTSELLDAVGFLNWRYGLCFNGFITLNFEQLGITSQRDASDALTAMNEAIAGYLRRYGARFETKVPHAFLYAHERCEKYGWHLHEVLTVPIALRHLFKPWLLTWKRRNFGSYRPDRAVHFRPSYGKTLQQQANIQARLVRYVLKTTAPAAGRDRFGQPASLHDLVGWKSVRSSLHLDVPRIAGCSQNISFGARLREGFEPAPYFEDMLSADRLQEHLSRIRAAELHSQLEGITL